MEDGKSFHQDERVQKLAEKFKSPTGGAIAERRIDAIVETIEKFEKLDDIRTLTRLLE